MIRPNYSLPANNHDQFEGPYHNRQAAHHGLDFPNCIRGRNILLKKYERFEVKEKK